MANVRVSSSYVKSSAYRPQPMTVRNVFSVSLSLRWSYHVVLSEHLAELIVPHR